MTVNEVAIYALAGLLFIMAIGFYLVYRYAKSKYNEGAE